MIWRCPCGKVNKRNTDVSCHTCRQNRDLALKATREDWPWGIFKGAELRSPDHAIKPAVVIAVLNFWQDLDVLKRTVPRWLPYFDEVRAFDGSYDGRLSTDGSREWLKEQNVQVYDCALPQTEKRTASLQEPNPNVMLVTIDADEFYIGAENLRDMPLCDVGWIRTHYSLYDRRYHQPRIFRGGLGLKVEGRHHWTFAWDPFGSGERVFLCSHRRGGVGFDHRLVNVTIINEPKKFRSDERLKERALMKRLSAPEEGSKAKYHEPRSGPSDNPIQVLQLTTYDAGGVVFRLHSAINTTTRNSSIYGTIGGSNPFRFPQQHITPVSNAELEAAALSADVIHHHLQYHNKYNRPSAVRVIHHHGQMFRRNRERYNLTDQMADLRLVSNMEMTKYSEDLKFLPNPIPVAQYQRLTQGRVEWPEDSTFKIGHSPSVREFKGTDQLLSVVRNMQAKGYKVELILLEKVDHANCLRLKATCHVFFDAFFLGIQCAGLEAAAMWMPVIAGDYDCQAAFGNWIGEVPYTFAPSGKELEAVLTQMYHDHDYRQHEAERVFQYVRSYHDYAAVTRRYFDLLREAGFK